MLQLCYSFSCEHYLPGSDKIHLSFLSLYVSSRIKQREEGVVVKPEGKSGSAAPGIKTEAEIPTSVGKTDGENSVPASKAVSLLYF